MNSNPPDDQRTDHSQAAETSGADGRRGFIAKLTGLGLAAAAYAVPVVGGVFAALHPLRAKGGGPAELRVTSLESLPADGVPRKFPVVAERTDAWTRAVQPIGAVYLRRTEDDQIQALQVVCPHAGCTVEFKESVAADGGQGAPGFVCPCHKAMFDLTGERLQDDSPSPRDMDALAVEIRDESEVWVRFQNFKVGTPAKVPVS
jgi:menaquinol-cytochrome c reductase iron-sulfur subunit